MVRRKTKDADRDRPVSPRADRFDELLSSIGDAITFYGGIADRAIYMVGQSGKGIALLPQ